MIEMMIVGSTGTTQEELQNTFYYEDGHLFFKEFTITRNRISELSNKKIGYKNKDGYIQKWWKNKKWYLHRMIFLYHHGYLPEQVDHIDGDKANNKIENLRAATNSLNMHNVPKRKDNTSGVKGVYYCKRSKKWVAEIKVNNKKRYVGHFATKEEAAAELAKVRIELVKEFAHHG